MALDAGILRHRVTIQARQESQDTNTGEAIFNWVNFATVWAAIEPVSGREFIQSQTTQSEIVARIVIRYRAGLLPTMRILHGSKIYNPAAFLADKDSGLEYLTIPCSLGVNDGQ